MMHLPICCNYFTDSDAVNSNGIQETVHETVNQPETATNNSSHPDTEEVPNDTMLSTAMQVCFSWY